MAYDPVKAHEYYMKYRKKGLLKGRKKAKSKKKSKKKSTVKKTNLVGLSTSGLNDTGKMQWALTKEKISKEMNEALAKATTPEEKDKIRQEYQNKALAELQKIKADPNNAKAKTTKAKAAKAKTSSSKKSTSPAKEKKSNATTKTKTKTKTKTTATKKTTYPSKSGKVFSADNAVSLEEFNNIKAEQKQKIQAEIDEIKARLQDIPEEDKEKIREALQAQIDKLKKRLEAYG